MAENKISIKLAVNTDEAGKLTASMDKVTRSLTLAEQIAADNDRKSKKRAEEITAATQQIIALRNQAAQAQAQVFEKLKALQDKINTDPSRAQYYFYALKEATISANASIEQFKQKIESAQKTIYGALTNPNGFKILEDARERIILESLARQVEATRAAAKKEDDIRAANFAKEQARLRQLELDRTKHVAEGIKAAQLGLGSLHASPIRSTATSVGIGAALGIGKKEQIASLAQARIEAEKMLPVVEKTNNAFLAMSKHILEVVSIYKVYNTLINLTSSALLSIPKTGIQLEQTVASLTASFGSAGNAVKELQFLNAEAKRTGVAIGTLRENYASASASFLAAGESADTVRQVFSNLNTVTTTLHLNQQQTGSIYLALSQIFNKTKLQAEELTKQLSQVIPGVTNAQAKALGITVAELYDKMKKGAISAHDAVLALSQVLADRFGGNAFETAAKGLNAETQRLSTNWTLLTENLYKISEGGMKNFVKSAANVLDKLIQLTSDTTSLSSTLTILSKTIGTGLIAGLSAYSLRLYASVAAATTAGKVFLELAATQGKVAAATTIASNSIKTFATFLDTNKWTIMITALAAVAAHFKGVKDEADAMRESILKTIEANYALKAGEKVDYDIKQNPEYQKIENQIKFLEDEVNKARERIKIAATFPGTDAQYDEEFKRQQDVIRTDLGALNILKEQQARVYADLVNGPKIDTSNVTDITAIIEKTQEALDNADPTKGEKARDKFLKGVKDIIPALQAEIEKQGPKAEEARKALSALYSKATDLQIQEDKTKQTTEQQKLLEEALKHNADITKVNLEKNTIQYNANLISVEEFFKRKEELIKQDIINQQNLLQEKVNSAVTPLDQEQAANELQKVRIENDNILLSLQLEKAQAEKKFGEISKQVGFSIIGTSKNAADEMARLVEEYDKATKSARQLYIQSLEAKNIPETQRNSLIQEYDNNQRVEAVKKASDEVDKYIEQIDKAKEHNISFGDVSNTIFSGQLSAISKLGDAFGRLITNIQNTNQALQENADKLIQNQEIADPVKRHLNENALIEEKAKLEGKATKQELVGISQIAGAAAMMFDKKGKAAKALHAIEMGLAAARMAMELKEMAQTAMKTVVDVAGGAAKMFSQSGWLGFAGVAAMLAVMAGLGFASSGSSSSYVPNSSDSGTVLGDKSAKSESITNVAKLLNDIHAREYKELRGINSGVLNLSSGISSLVAKFFQMGGLPYSDPGLGKSGNAAIFDKLGGKDPVAKFLLTKDPAMNMITKILMGVPKIVDKGIIVYKAYVNALVNGLNLSISQFWDIEQKGLFGSSKQTITKKIDSSNPLAKGITAIFRGAAESILGMTNIFGADRSEAFANYVMPKFKVSLKGNAEKVQKKLQNAISTALDKMSENIFGGLIKNYQQIGEGLYETSIRLASQMAVTKKFISQMGGTVTINDKEFVAFADALAQSGKTGTAAENLKELTTALSDFYSTFTSDKKKASDSFTNLTEQLAFAFSKLTPEQEGLVSSFSNSVISTKSFRQSIRDFIGTLGTSNVEVTKLMLDLSSVADAIAKIQEDTLKPVLDNITKLSDDIDTTSIEALYTQLANTKDLTEQTKIVKKINDKIMANYSTQLSAIKNLTSSLFNLKKVVDSLKLSALTILDPKQKLEEAKRQYVLLLNKVNNGTAEEAAAAAADLGNAAQQYLTEAKAYFGSTEAYATIFKEVTDVLTTLSNKNVDQTQAIIDATKDLATNAIEQLNTLATNYTTAFNNYLQEQIAIQKGNLPPETGPNFLTNLYKQFENVVAGGDKTKIKEAQRLIDAYNIGGEAFYNAVKSGDKTAIQTIKDTVQDQIDKDTNTLKTKQLLLKHAASVEEKNQLEQDITDLKAKIAKEKLVVKFKAEGGVTSGLTLVGERGPELLNLPGNTKVINNTNTQRLLTQQGAAQYNVLTDIKDELTRLNSRMETIERKTRLASA